FLKGLIGTWPAAGGADTVTNLRNLCAYAFSFVPIWAYAHKVHASVIRLWRSQLRSRHSVKRNLRLFAAALLVALVSLQRRVSNGANSCEFQRIGPNQQSLSRENR